MAEGTPLRLNGRMFIDERPKSIYMALSADGVLGRTKTDHLWLKGAVRVMAVGAFNQPFRNPVVKGLHKCRIDVGVALITESGLLRLEQGSLRLWLVNAVAVGATYKTFTMRTSCEVRVIAYVTREALLVDFFRWGFCEPEECIRATTAFDMRP